MPNRGEGPIPARIMIVGESWGAEEERLGTPFVGASGQELNRMLQEAGIMRSECFVSNVVNYRPPGNDISAWMTAKKKKIPPDYVPLRDQMVLPLVAEGYRRLLVEIDMVQPNVIVACGNVALWALTGKWGIRKWRGSLLSADIPVKEGLPPKVIPTIHPAAVLYEWSQRAAVVNDLRRVTKHWHSREYQFPKYNFIVRPSFGQVTNAIVALLNRLDSGESLWIDVDLETANGHIACCGISWSRLDAICIPFTALGHPEGYWSAEEEAQIIYLLYRLMTHQKVQIRWQNGLYDAQYIHRHWHFIPRGQQDTMISQHSIFSDQPKSLAYQASLYAEHYVFWKDEGKTWKGKKTAGDEEEGWVYNCKDCVYTREVGEVELDVAAKMGLKEVHDLQQKMFWPVLRAMLRGVRVIPENRARLAAEVQDQIAHREQLLIDMLGHPINPRSPTQMQKLFYTDFGQQEIRTRAKKGSPSHVTCDDEALQKLVLREPLLKPIINCIQDIRTLEIFLGNFILAKLDVDGRMRCSYNIGGSSAGKSAPKTYRLSSSKNAFDSGGNLQNIPSEKSKSVGKASARGHMAMLGDPYQLPNVRSLYGPDPGYTFFDMDLDRADLQVVVWEADDAMLKAALRMGADIHLLNAYVLEGKEPPPLEELVETHPKYPDHRGPLKLLREFAKVFCHATNYGGGARTVAAHLGRLVREVELAQRKWFGAHPGIKRWHEDVKAQVFKRRYVENKFGYRWYIFDRLDSIIPEAIAWGPQSTVSIVINKSWLNIYNYLPEVEVLLQVHDSLAGQFPTHKPELVKQIQEQSRIVVPYDDPLIIPTGIGTSQISWGDC